MRRKDPIICLSSLYGCRGLVFLGEAGCSLCSVTRSVTAQMEAEKLLRSFSP